jgi:uncharacterized protein (DUF952 family)
MPRRYPTDRAQPAAQQGRSRARPGGAVLAPTGRLLPIRAYARDMLIHHIALATEWDAALAAGAYRTSTLGHDIDEVGYIHASRADQVQATATAFYADVTGRLVVLVMDEDTLRAAGLEVRHEDNGAGELFPHVYGEIPVALVAEVRPASFDHGTLTF